jgi:acetyl esterase/lipase
MVGRWWRGRLPTAPQPRLRKDVGTRPLFRHLAAQGHVVVDVAYRLFPETDLPGMVADAKRALAWVQDHAADLQIRPDRIVLAGGSAGAHLGLLAASTHQDPALTPAELTGSDPRVCGVVSLYGQADLEAHYRHTSQQKTCRPDDPQPNWDAPPPSWMARLFGANAGRLKLHLAPAGRLDWLVGGTPSQLPDRYAQLSPLHRVHPGCPPTLLLHGEHDEMAPVAAMRQLQRRLEQAGVPVTGVYLPHTDHAFDLLATTWSPPARVAIHVLERFLAALATTDRTSAPQPISGAPAERAALPQARPV